VARGSMLYSAVIQPLPEPFMKDGTDSSIDAVHITRVLPTSMSAEPSAVWIKSGIMFTGRSWSGERLSERNTMSLFLAVILLSGHPLFFDVDQLYAFQ
jgi:hypothetical protein